VESALRAIVAPCQASELLPAFCRELHKCPNPVDVVVRFTHQQGGRCRPMSLAASTRYANTCSLLSAINSQNFSTIHSSSHTIPSAASDNNIGQGNNRHLLQSSFSPYPLPLPHSTSKSTIRSGDTYMNKYVQGDPFWGAPFWSDFRLQRVPLSSSLDDDSPELDRQESGLFAKSVPSPTAPQSSSLNRKSFWDR